MTDKSQELYNYLLEQLVTRLPEFKPVTLISDLSGLLEIPFQKFSHIFGFSDGSSTILNHSLLYIRPTIKGTMDEVVYDEKVYKHSNLIQNLICYNK